MLISAPDTVSHFFLVGPRVPPGSAFPQAERVGTLVIRQRLDASGASVEAGDVLTADEPFAGADPAGPFRLEAEIATWKPAPDVVIVGAAPAPPAPSPLHDYGSVTVTRAGGGATLFPRVFDWLPRAEGPRLALAGQEAPPPADGSTLAEFDAATWPLPRGYSNAFQNGQPLPGAPLLATGDRLDFTPNAGLARTVTIPTAPVLAAQDDMGKPLANAPVLVPRVDTVVFDLVAAVFTLIWRTTFVWETRFETATLEVSANG